MNYLIRCQIDYINKKPINADCSALNEQIETNHKVPKFKVNYRVRITKDKNRTFLWKRVVVEYIISESLSRTRQLY